MTSVKVAVFGPTAGKTTLINNLGGVSGQDATLYKLNFAGRQLDVRELNDIPTAGVFDFGIYVHSGSPNTHFAKKWTKRYGNGKLIVVNPRQFGHPPDTEAGPTRSEFDNFKCALSAMINKF